jgi:hypothetical protein
VKCRGRTPSAPSAPSARDKGENADSPTRPTPRRPSARSARKELSYARMSACACVDRGTPGSGIGIPGFLARLATDTLQVLVFRRALFRLLSRPICLPSFFLNWSAIFYTCFFPAFAFECASRSLILHPPSSSAVPAFTSTTLLISPRPLVFQRGLKPRDPMEPPLSRRILVAG